MKNAYILIFSSLVIILSSFPSFARISAQGAFSYGIEALEKGDLRTAKSRFGSTTWYAIREKEKEGWTMTSQDYQIGSMGYLYKGLTEIKLGENRQAFSDFVMAEKYSKNFPDIQIQIAAQYFKLDLIEETKRLCKSILDQYPDNAGAYYFLGYSELKSGNREKAINYANLAKELGYPYADFLLQAIDKPGKKKQMEDIQETLPEDFLRVAIRKFEEGNYDQAIDICEKILKGNSNHGLAHYYLGFSYFKKGQSRKALTHAEKAKGLGVSYADLLIEKLKK